MICGDLDKPYIKTDSNVCPTCSARGALSVTREKALVDLINDGTPPPTGLFPCDITSIREKIPGVCPIRHVGGMGNHHDHKFSNDVTVELKVSQKKNPSPISVIRRIPWKDTVQFLQGQVKSAVATTFLDSCGKPMLEAWWKRVGDPEIPFEDYMKAMYDISRKYSGVDPKASAWIEHLRSSKIDQKRIQKEWLAFENEWFAEHKPSTEILFNVVDRTLREKQYWLCISTRYAIWVPGPVLRSITFDRIKQKAKGGSTFLYTMNLEQEGEEYSVPLELKFHWKNGGQGVQNLNFMLL